MLELPIFINREKLSPRYIPSILPHRKKQIDVLFTLSEDTFEHIEKVFLRVIQIVGDVGTGKTCTVTRFGEKLEEKASPPCYRRGCFSKTFTRWLLFLLPRS